MYFLRSFSHLANTKNYCVHSKSFLLWLYFKILSLITFLGHVFTSLQKRFFYCLTRKVGSHKNKSTHLYWFHSQKFAAAKDLQVLTIAFFLFCSPLNSCSNTTFYVTKNICMHLYQSQIIWIVPITCTWSFRGLPADWEGEKPGSSAHFPKITKSKLNSAFFLHPFIALGFILKQTQVVLNTDSTGVLFT